MMEAEEEIIPGNTWSPEELVEFFEKNHIFNEPSSSNIRKLRKACKTKIVSLPKEVKPKGWYVVAGPPDLKVGSMYYDQTGICVQLRQHMDKKHLETRDMKYLFDLCDALAIANSRIRDDDDHKEIILGKYGDIWTDSVYWYLYVEARSKRHFSALKRKLSFMNIVLDRGKEGEFKLDRMPRLEEAEAIRKALGLWKSRNKGGTDTEGTLQNEGVSA